MRAVAGDADGDGRLDILVTNENMPNFQFHNEGNGKFRDMPRGPVFHGTAGRTVYAIPERLPAANSPT
ncbi:MAG TPA: VCBS repeat-containing protein [Bryobacteraceae bacterium]|jgi:hypothetical protein|nr:VCBS repeat-containing protein [Bryobacteraceae bacterium]